MMLDVCLCQSNVVFGDTFPQGLANPNGLKLHRNGQTVDKGERSYSLCILALARSLAEGS